MSTLKDRRLLAASPTLPTASVDGAEWAARRPVRPPAVRFRPQRLKYRRVMWLILRGDVAAVVWPSRCVAFCRVLERHRRRVPTRRRGTSKTAADCHAAWVVAGWGRCAGGVVGAGVGTVRPLSSRRRYVERARWLTWCRVCAACARCSTTASRTTPAMSWTALTSRVRAPVVRAVPPGGPWWALFYHVCRVSASICRCAAPSTRCVVGRRPDQRGRVAAARATLVIRDWKDFSSRRVPARSSTLLQTKTHTRRVKSTVDRSCWVTEHRIYLFIISCCHSTTKRLTGLTI